MAVIEGVRSLRFDLSLFRGIPGERGRPRVKGWRCQCWSADREPDLETSAGVQTGKLVQEVARDYSVFQKGSDFQSVGKPMREVSTMG